MPCLGLEHSKSLISTQKYIKNPSKAYSVQPNPPPALSSPAPPTSLLPDYTLSTLPLLMLDWVLGPRLVLWPIPQQHSLLAAPPPWVTHLHIPFTPLIKCHFTKKPTLTALLNIVSALARCTLACSPVPRALRANQPHE